MAENTPSDFLRWYYFTRSLGVFILLFAVLADTSPERGTLILTGAGLLGLDKVVRTEKRTDNSSNG